MKILLKLLIALNLCSPCIALAKNITLTQQESIKLETFFRSILVNSEAGYVLFGEKPVCIEGIISDESFAFLVGTKYHQFSVELATGLQILKKLPISNNNIIIHEYDIPEYGYQHVVFINKTSFEKVVNENLSLFQYVLGPTITPTSLLDELTSPNTTFSKVLHEDKVLIGILLGYGTQNALFHSRLEYLQENYGDESEITNLSEKLVPSLELVYRQYPSLPIFGCDKKNPETTHLISSYDQTHEKIRQVLEANDFLTEILNTLEECTLETIPPSNKPLPNQKTFSKITSKALSKYVHQMSPEFISGFKKGISDKNKTHKSLSPSQISKLYSQSTTAEKSNHLQYQIGYEEGIRIKNYYQKYENENIIESISQALQTPEKTPLILTQDIITSHWDLYQKKRQNLLDEATTFINKLHKDKSLQCLIKNLLYQKIIQPGSRQKHNKITLSYTISDHQNTPLYQVSNREYSSIDIEHMIPGMKLALLNAKPGEKGTLYIHPKLGFPYSCTELGDQLLIVNYEVSPSNDN